MTNPIQFLVRLAVGLFLALLVLMILLILVAQLLGPPGLVAVLALLGVLALGYAIRRRRLPRRIMLELDLEHPVVEQLPQSPFGMIGGQRVTSLRDLVFAIERATDDRRVVGILARIGPTGISLAHAQEIRTAVEAFRRTGRKTIAFCLTLGEGSSATSEYYLATAFEEIHLQPTGDVGFNGMMIEQPFVRGLLDRLGITPRFDHRREYKSMKYLFTEDHLVEPHRQQLDGLLSSRAEQVAEGIAAGRSLTAERVRELLDEGPFRAEEALEHRLVDRLSYHHEIDARIKDELKAKTIAADAFLGRAGHPHRKGPQVALICGVGSVMRGKGRGRSLTPTNVMGADEITAAFRTAIDSKKIKAIVFRIESPGGSAVASEAIWREVKRAREAGKPVIASMSSVAGSGGYYIAASATKIVAQPATITGSIGVVVGKLVTRETWQKIGINWDGVQVGRNAGIWSSRHDFSDAGWSRVQASLDDVYQTFMQRVAEGRLMDPQRVEELAGGRIWTGQQAKENGLVDELGGLSRAIELAKQEINVPPHKHITLVQLPQAGGMGLLGPRTPMATVHCSPAEEVLELLEPMRPCFAALDPAVQQPLHMGYLAC
jgi:protease IV